MNTSADCRRADYPRLLGLSWGHFLNDGASNYLPGILPAVLISLHLSVSWAGVLIAAMVAGQALQPVTGLIADRVGGRVFIVAGIVGTSIGGALIGLMPSQWSLIVLLVVTGLCNSLFHPQALAATRMISGHRQGSSMGLFLVGGEVGRGAWPLIVSWMIAKNGLNLSVQSLWVLAIPALITLPLVWKHFPKVPPKPRDIAPLNLRAHWAPLSCLVGYCALRSVMIYATITFLPILWHQKGGLLIGGAGFVSVVLLIGIIGNVGGGHLSDYFERRTIIVSASFISAALLAGFMIVGGWLGWILLGLLGIALFSTVSLTVLVAQDILPENKSMAGGIGLGFANGIGALILLILGPIANHWGVASTIWIAVACGLGAIPLGLALPKAPQRNVH